MKRIHLNDAFTSKSLCYVLFFISTSGIGFLHASEYCYDNEYDNSYNGTMNISISGLPCIAWKDLDNDCNIVSEQSIITGNACLNTPKPGCTMRKPWCMVQVRDVRYNRLLTVKQHCDVPQCGNSEYFSAQALGMESGDISDSQISLSNHIRYVTDVQMTNLKKLIRFSKTVQGNIYDWYSGRYVKFPISVNVQFNTSVILTAIAFQGSHSYINERNSIQLIFSEDNYNWQYYKENGQIRTYEALYNQYSVNKIHLRYPIKARHIGIILLNKFTIKFELYGIRLDEESQTKPIELKNHIIEDTTLTLANSPYVIDNREITVVKGVVLSIEKGATLLMNGNRANLKIKGCMWIIENELLEDKVKIFAMDNGTSLFSKNDKSENLHKGINLESQSVDCENRIRDIEFRGGGTALFINSYTNFNISRVKFVHIVKEIELRQGGQYVLLDQITSNHQFGKITLDKVNNVYINQCKHEGSIDVVDGTARIKDNVEITNSKLYRFNIYVYRKLNSFKSTNNSFVKLEVKIINERLLIENCTFRKDSYLYLKVISTDANINNCLFNNAQISIYKPVNISSSIFMNEVYVYMSHSSSSATQKTLITDSTFVNISKRITFKLNRGVLEMSRNVFENCRVVTLFYIGSAHLYFHRNLFPESAVSLVDYFVELRSKESVFKEPIDARYNYMSGLQYNQLATSKSRHLGCKYFYVDSKLRDILLSPMLSQNNWDTVDYIIDDSRYFRSMEEGGQVVNDTELTISDDIVVNKSVLIDRNVTLVLNVAAKIKFSSKRGMRVLGHLIINGSSNCTLTSDSSLWNAFDIANGTVTIRNCLIQHMAENILVYGDSKFILQSCTMVNTNLYITIKDCENMTSLLIEDSQVDHQIKTDYVNKCFLNITISRSSMSQKLISNFDNASITIKDSVYKNNIYSSQDTGLFNITNSSLSLDNVNYNPRHVELSSTRYSARDFVDKLVVIIKDVNYTSTIYFNKVKGGVVYVFSNNEITCSPNKRSTSERLSIRMYSIGKANIEIYGNKFNDCHANSILITHSSSFNPKIRVMDNIFNSVGIPFSLDIANSYLNAKYRDVTDIVAEFNNNTVSGCTSATSLITLKSRGRINYHNNRVVIAESNIFTNNTAQQVMNVIGDVRMQRNTFMNPNTLYDLLMSTSANEIKNVEVSLNYWNGFYPKNRFNMLYNNGNDYVRYLPYYKSEKLSLLQYKNNIKSLGGVLWSDYVVAENSTVTVSEPWIIATGVTLTIQPGATLLFNSHASIVVHGCIRVEGEQDNRVAMLPSDNSLQGKQWNGITFMQISGRVKFEDDHEESSGIAMVKINGTWNYICYEYNTNFADLFCQAKGFNGFERNIERLKAGNRTNTYKTYIHHTYNHLSQMQYRSNNCKYILNISCKKKEKVKKQESEIYFNLVAKMNSSYFLSVDTSAPNRIERSILVEETSSPNSKMIFSLVERKEHNLDTDDDKVFTIESLHYPGSFLSRDSTSKHSPEDEQVVFLKLMDHTHTYKPSELFIVNQSGIYDVVGHPIVFDGQLKIVSSNTTSGFVATPIYISDYHTDDEEIENDSNNINTTSNDSVENLSTLSYLNIDGGRYFAIKVMGEVPIMEKLKITNSKIAISLQSLIHSEINIKDCEFVHNEIAVNINNNAQWTDHIDHMYLNVNNNSFYNNTNDVLINSACLINAQFSSCSFNGGNSNFRVVRLSFGSWMIVDSCEFKNSTSALYSNSDSYIQVNNCNFTDIHGDTKKTALIKISLNETIVLENNIFQNITRPYVGLIYISVQNPVISVTGNKFTDNLIRSDLLYVDLKNGNEIVNLNGNIFKRNTRYYSYIQPKTIHILNTNYKGHTNVSIQHCVFHNPSLVEIYMHIQRYSHQIDNNVTVDASHSEWMTSDTRDIYSRINSLNNDIRLPVVHILPLKLYTTSQDTFFQNVSTIGGPIFSDLTLRRDHSPYKVTSTIYIKQGFTFNIESGVELIFKDDKIGIYADGILNFMSTKKKKKKKKKN